MGIGRLSHTTLAGKAVSRYVHRKQTHLVDSLVARGRIQQHPHTLTPRLGHASARGLDEKNTAQSGRHVAYMRHVLRIFLWPLSPPSCRSCRSCL